MGGLRAGRGLSGYSSAGDAHSTIRGKPGSRTAPGGENWELIPAAATEYAADTTFGYDEVDLVGRLGGDEFAIIVARCNIQLLKNIAERIIESFARDKLLVRIRQNHGLSVTCSIGAAMHPMHGNSIPQLLEISDEQMYQAKKSGKNCYRIAGVSEVAELQDSLKV